MEIPSVLKRLAAAVQNRKEEDVRLYHLFLTRYPSEYNTNAGYWALARLIREGYFSTILTSNTDSALEFALENIGLQYKVFVAGQDSDEQIVAALEDYDSGIHIVKLYDHRSQANCPSFPLDLLPEIQTGLQSYFNQSIIIVGSIDEEQHGILALHSHEEEGIYYVLPNDPLPNDVVVACIRKQEKRLDNFLITGTYGEFNAFFSVLDEYIRDRTGENRANITRPLSLEGVRIVLAPDSINNKTSITGAISIFYACSSSKEDLQLQEEIGKQLGFLRKQKLIDEWHSGKLEAGAEREAETRRRLENAQVILLLVSADLLASEDDSIIVRAMERHREGTAIVVPVILRPVEWQETAFNGLVALPDEGRPITSWSNRDDAFLSVAKGIRKIIENYGK
jgi:hypothetical protein